MLSNSQSHPIKGTQKSSCSKERSHDHLDHRERDPPVLLDGDLAPAAARREHRVQVKVALTRISSEGVESTLLTRFDDLKLFLECLYFGRVDRVQFKVTLALIRILFITFNLTLWKVNVNVVNFIIS